MGREASYQAIPEDCELLQQARKDKEIAEMMSSFAFYANRTHPLPSSVGEKENVFYREVKEIVLDDPGLIERYFYAKTQKFDAIHYLLSPMRREKPGLADTSLIYSAIYGAERLHPEVGIGFVPTKRVSEIASSLETVTEEILYEHCDLEQMWDRSVYKIFRENANQFEVIWEEFEGMRQVYRAAADHDEAMITTID